MSNVFDNYTNRLLAMPILSNAQDMQATHANATRSMECPYREKIRIQPTFSALKRLVIRIDIGM